MADSVANDIMAAQKRLNRRVLGKSGVSGTAIGQRSGAPCLVVYVSDERGAKSTPKSVDGFKVVVEKSGAFGRL